jgi:hypothetical protein
MATKIFQPRNATGENFGVGSSLLHEQEVIFKDPI